MRGLKAALVATASGKLSTFRGHPCYRTRDRQPLRGVTKALTRLHSDGTIPDRAPSAGRASFSGTAWRGTNGGMRRGRAVDAQVTRMVNRPRASPARPLKLTRLVFAALKLHKLKPVIAQYVVASRALRVGTAVDVVCVRADRTLILLELKCGYAASDRCKAARDGRGRECRMRTPVASAKDSVVNRHFAQLAATRALFVDDATRMQRIEAKGTAGVDAALLYVDNDSSELYAMPAWWARRGEALVRHVAS